MFKNILSLSLLLITFMPIKSSADDLYMGISSVKIDVDYQSIENVDLGLFYEKDFYGAEIYVGKKFDDMFVELGYFDTSNETKTLAGTYSGITFSGTTQLGFDGFRIGAGKNIKHNENLTSRLKINYYDIDITENLSAAVATGSATYVASASLSSSSDMLTLGYGLNFDFGNNLTLELDYEQSINEPTNIDEVKILGLNFGYKF